jgi:hypothetical protein
LLVPPWETHRDDTAKNTRPPVKFRRWKTSRV